MTQTDTFKYPTKLETVLEDLYWVNRNIGLRYLLDRYKDIDIKWSQVPPKEKALNQYYNFRQNKLIGGILRLSSFDRSSVTEEFSKLDPRVKELIIPAIPNRGLPT